MKSKLLPIALAGNVALLTGLLWVWIDWTTETRELMRGMVGAETQYQAILAQSLAAIESGDSTEAAATADMLRSFLSVGEANAEARRLAGF